MDIGYIREDSGERLAFCKVIYKEEGKEWERMVSEAREGDVIYVADLLEVANSPLGLWRKVKDFKERKLRLISLDGADTMEFGFLDALEKIANMQRERVRRGMEKHGRYGRPYTPLSKEEEAICLSLKLGVASRDEVLKETGMSEKALHALQERYQYVNGNRKKKKSDKGKGK